MTLYEIIKSLQTAKGSIAKQAILNANAGNELLKGYMKAVLDPAVNYYQTKLPAIDRGFVGLHEFGDLDLEFVQDRLASREVTGHDAISSLMGHTSALNAEGRELMGYIIKRAIGGSVGETMVLKAWPGLFFTVTYMRCAGMSPKVKAEYAALPYFFVQTKYDGSFGYLRTSDHGASLFTRAGSFYPAWLAEKLAKNLPIGYVVMGEVLVFEGGKPLSRKVSNGMLNSLLQGSEATGADIRMVAWDMVPSDEFEEEECVIPYEGRMDFMRICIRTESLSLAKSEKVTSLEQAFALNREALLRGEEGTCWKKPDGIWRDSSSGTRDAVKVKIVFEAEYIVTGKYEGDGKAKGMLGGFNIATSCGMIVNNVGSGFSDAQRKEYWEADTDGWIVTLEANDVIDKTGSATESLFLPIFVERRLDKTEADSRERVLEQLQAAKEGS